MMWRPSVLGWETIANAVVHRSRLVVVTLLATGLIGGVAYAEMVTTATAVHHTRELLAAGRHVYKVTSIAPEDRLTLDADRCHEMLELPQIVAAGGVIDAGYTTLYAAPGTPLRRIEVTGLAMSVFAPDTPAPSPGGGWLSATAGRRLGIPDGARVTDGIDTYRVAWVNPDRRHPNGPVLVAAPSASRKIDECWFEVLPGGSTSAVEIGHTFFPSGTVAVSQLLPDTEFSIDPLTTFQDRATRWLWLGAGLSLGFGIVALHWFTRSETALYRLLGLSRTAVIAMHAITHIVVLAAATLGGVVGAGLLARHLPGFDAQAIRIGVFSAAATSMTAQCIVVTGAALVASGSVTKQLKDR